MEMEMELVESWIWSFELAFDVEFWLVEVGLARVYIMGGSLPVWEVGDMEISVSVVPKGPDAASTCGLVIGAATVWVVA